MPRVWHRRQPVLQPRPAGQRSPEPVDQSRKSPARRSTSALPAIAGLVLVGLSLLIIGLINSRQPQPTTSVEGGTIAYVCQQGAETHICVQDSSGRRQVFHCGLHDWTPAWSPDGRYIALASDADGSMDIWILEPETGVAYPLTTGIADAASSPSWSPDERSIVFDLDAEGNYDVYTQQVGGSVPTRLTRNSARDSDPAWSPDGQHIAFVSDRQGSDLEIYVMDARGQNVTRLTNHAGRDFAPIWSPDGEQIAYECVDDAEGDIEICVMDVASRSQQVLTRNRVDDRQPAWSPDGQYIAFCRERSGGSVWDIWVMEAEGTNQRVRVQDSYSNTHPSWKP